MKYVYPIILTPAEEGGYVVRVPALDIGTQGETLAEAIDMARDAIGLWGITTQDMKQEIPTVDFFDPPHTDNEIVTLVDIDFDAYRKANDLRAVRKNVTIPAYLEYAAEQAGLNFSRILQDALKKELGIA